MWGNYTQQRTTTTAAVSLLNMLTEVPFSKYSILLLLEEYSSSEIASYSPRSSRREEWWKHHFGLFRVCNNWEHYCRDN
jgi:hypothetical protein